MPIYEYYSPDTNRIYSFFAKTLAQGRRVPKCPDDPKARMVKLVSSFAIGGGGGEREPGGGGGDAAGPGSEGGSDDPRMEQALGAMEKEFSAIDENDPRAMARMMRRMSELTGEKMDEPMEAAMRKLEEGADPESLEEEFGDAFGDDGGGGSLAGPEQPAGEAPKSGRRRVRTRRPAPVRDPKLYDYD